MVAEQRVDLRRHAVERDPWRRELAAHAFAQHADRLLDHPRDLFETLQIVIPVSAIAKRHALDVTHDRVMPTAALGDGHEMEAERVARPFAFQHQDEQRVGDALGFTQGAFVDRARLLEKVAALIIRKGKRRERTVSQPRHRVEVTAAHRDLRLRLGHPCVIRLEQFVPRRVGVRASDKEEQDADERRHDDSKSGRHVVQNVPARRRAVCASDELRPGMTTPAAKVRRACRGQRPGRRISRRHPSG